MNIFDLVEDKVIGGKVALGSITYKYAFENLVPLINQTDFQRKLQDEAFYSKLKRDIIDGCVMPAITVAYLTDVDKVENISLDNILDFIKENSNQSFILDGIQRLNTMNSIDDKNKNKIENNILYLNIIISDTPDKLLYRMITLNNGQRPMTPRHQVEAMMKNAFNFEDYNIKIQTEKERSDKVIVSAFNKADIIQAYLAYMAGSPIIDNKKIIEERMDDLLVSKIIDQDPLKNVGQFNDVLRLIEKIIPDPVCLKWLKITNNLVGVSVGLKRNTNFNLDKYDINDFKTAIENFDKAFTGLNPSRIKVGKMRRELATEFFSDFESLYNKNHNDLLSFFSELD